ncbi:hypothetical protein A9257_21720 [Vibrio cyclitrophicus]|uniref:hypothetical protein n=1 Tax=Vibrio cyclitrophicus TaxID=47951 RepID=UPI0007EEB780|nr:hypothetical protein [Vibrio cyclitrophicus]OBT00022.1 hypothetical protein A9257_21720 [Vibrio cyclitrophicus]PMN19494.1 hypothetical protein BCT37_19980 [Vibrio cyclitrophicus]
MEMNSNSPCYVMLPKRNLSRYVLTYELLPLELCFEVNEKKVFSEIELQSMIAQNLIDEKVVVLRLKDKLTSLYQPFSNITKLGFTNQDSLDMFIDRSYENYDLSSMECYVLENDEANVTLPLDIAEPPTVEKHLFSKKMAFNDAIIAATHSTLLSSNDFSSELKQYLGNPERLLEANLSHYVRDQEQLKIAAIFYRICCDFNIDNGWQLSEVVEKFKALVITENIASQDVDRWVETAEKIINNDDVKLIYTDEINVALRAMILVLLNPEKQNIDAMKVNLGEGLGEDVYALANLFALARTGYSYLSADDRKQLKERAELQLLNASLYNEITIDVEATFEPEEENIEIECNDKFSLTEVPWLNCETENLFSLKHVKPMSGFDLALVYKQGELFAWRLIDANGEKGLDKLKGQLALNLLAIQKDLPSSVRAELIESHGLLLTLPLEWLTDPEAHVYFEGILSLLISIKVAQKSSKII